MRARLEAICFQNDDALVTAALQTLLGTAPLDDLTNRVPLVFAVMKALDNAFYLIHPRAQVLPAGLSRRPVMPEWLESLQADRSMTGYYAKDSNSVLIPKGPLLRMPAEVFHTSADNLRDRFAAVAVGKTTLEESGRPVGVSVFQIGQNPIKGLISSANNGRETIAFVPIAKSNDDLERSLVERGENRFVKIAPSSKLDPAAILMQAIEQMGPVDVAFAPEFVTPVADAARFARELPSKRFPRPRMILAGTGITEDIGNGKQWNEARVYNSFGRELWRQRKVWPAGLSEAQAKSYGLGAVGENRMLLEDTEAGDEIIVADLDGFGRAVLLICQDVQAQPLTNELIMQYQPDWVFVPILDRGIESGRWMHQRAYELSKISQARFLISSSISMCFWNPSYSPSILPAIGLAVGPIEPTPAPDGSLPDMRRAVKDAILKSDSDLFAVIEWRSSGWRQTRVDFS